MDFSQMINSANGNAVVAALTALAAVKVFVVFAKWGYNKVIHWFEVNDQY